MSVTASAPADLPASARRRWRPRTAVVVAVVAFVNALAWGLIIPPYHVPDEAAHSFYAGYLAETGKLPRSIGYDWYSTEERAVLTDELFPLVVGVPGNKPPADRTSATRTATDLAAGLERTGVGDAATASNNPPLYYLVQAGAYKLASGADLLDRLALMRVVSALMGAFTVLFIFLFLRELLPGTPQVWALGALVAAFQPTFGFITAGVNNDAALYLVAAALFWSVARLFREGFSPMHAALPALLVGIGALVKTQMLAFAPGVALAIVVCAWRIRGGGRVPWRGLALSAGALLLPLLLYAILGATVLDRSAVDRVGDVTASANPLAHPWLWREQVSFGWQLYLPRLPFMTDLLPGVPLVDVWQKDLVGYFGYLDYRFPAWVSSVGIGVWAIVAVAAGVQLWQRRDALSARWTELAVYAVMAIGLAAAIAVAAYRYRVNGGARFEQARYLLPLLSLYAAIAALAVRAAGRWAPVAGVVLVVAACGHSLFAQLITLARYYA